LKIWKASLPFIIIESSFHQFFDAIMIKKTMYGALQVEELMTISDDDFELQLSPSSKEYTTSSSSSSSAQRSPRSFLSSFYGRSFVSAVTIIAITLVLYISYSSGKDSMVTLYSASEEETSSSGVKFTLKRAQYAPLRCFVDSSRDFLKYRILKEHIAVIEPHAPMQVHLFGDSDTDKFSYRFQICPSSSSSSSSSTACYSSVMNAKQESGSVTIACKPQSIYSITVTELHPSTNTPTSRSVQGTALCMYVRRDIESLSADDLSATMDAMHALWLHNEEEGRAKYGDDFRSSTFFSEAHHFNAAWIESDHIHEGLGFIPQHLKLSNRFEKAMQAVNPAVSLPYW
jgi:hypothetical protein